MIPQCIGWTVEEANELKGTHVRAVIFMPYVNIPAGTLGVIVGWIELEGCLYLTVHWPGFPGTTICRDHFADLVRLV